MRIIRLIDFSRKTIATIRYYEIETEKRRIYHRLFMMMEGNLELQAKKRTALQSLSYTVLVIA